MGFGGNAEPSFLIPTAVASADSDIVATSKPGAKDGISDLEYFVGEEAVSTKMYPTTYPIEHGRVENWNNMERLWQRCFYEYLRVEPDEHVVMLVRKALLTGARSAE
jgi:actin-related protein 3